MSDFSVYVVNPKKKASKNKAAKKKTASRRRRATNKGESTTMAKKKTTRRRRRAPAAAPPARRRRRAAPAAPARRRRRNPAPASRRRRRRNPNGALGLGVSGVFAEVKNALPRLAGTLAVAWAVRQFGKGGGLFGQQFTSPTMGESWGWSQYAIAGAVAMWGPKLLGKFINAKEFQRGAVDLIVQKLVWTEGIARSDWAVQQFGNTIGIDSGSGQMYMDQGGGNYAAMQGYGNLVEASPMDGLVEASPMDGSHGMSSYGHLLPAGVSAQTAATGRYTGSGYTSNYHAAFAR